MYDVSASTLFLNRYQLQPSLWIGKYQRDPSLGLGIGKTFPSLGLSIGETLHLDWVSARPFTLDQYRRDPSLGLGIGETLHLDRVSALILPFGLISASFGFLIGSLGLDNKFRE
ncbi:hypothetical protein RhiirC2_800481 [Rhizophagus irregularis]|uniref:Uncharacterized protein n=1 Tax=Rhizophagus irregularis TaxID=588596 RepID=A0A2N1M3M4_9GLOM|nr:hypothetical protein RhiirC2_800481 [Rhizophagus irregularis]